MGSLALGLVVLGYGIVRGSREARLASAALVALSVGKVFLYESAKPVFTSAGR